MSLVGATGGSAAISAMDVAKAPILILAAESEFGAYAEEILRAEGWNEFAAMSPLDPRLTAEYLGQFDTTILTETKLDPPQAKLLIAYVRAGGNLIAFRPDPKLAAVFGISTTGRTLSDGYIKLDTQNDLAAGLSGEALQFHGPADEYELSGGVSVATLGEKVDAVNRAPAVVRSRFGSGYGIAFAYNLPKSIALCRQGNPQIAGTETDGIKGIRAGDMFTHGWLTPPKAPVNQSDEQMRLLSCAIERLNPQRPFPKLWYFPGRNRSVVTLTADGEDSPEKDFEAQLRDVKSEDVRMTVYLKGTYVSAEKVKSWVNEGFEIGAHVDDTAEAVQPTWNGMNARFQSALRAFRETYGIVPRTVRNHWVVWCGTNAEGKKDFVAQASIEANLGIRFDCNYYHFDQQSSQGHFFGPIGNFTGSGLPMKFVAETGQIVNVYQAITQLPDEQWGQGTLFENFELLLNRSLDGECYTFINANLHTDRWVTWSRSEGLKLIDYAKSRGVPIWTAERTLRFLERRNAVRFEKTDWRDSELAIRLQIPAGQDEPTLMLPIKFQDKRLNFISRNGDTIAVHPESIKGSEYCLVPLPAGDVELVAKYTGTP